MIVFGTNFTTCFNDNVTWKPWRMCSGRKWRVEVLAVSGGNLGDIQHRERSVCVSLMALGFQVALRRMLSDNPVSHKKSDHLLGCWEVSSMSCSVGVFQQLPSYPSSPSERTRAITAPCLMGPRDSHGGSKAPNPWMSSAKNCWLVVSEQ